MLKNLLGTFCWSPAGWSQYSEIVDGLGCSTTFLVYRQRSKKKKRESQREVVEVRGDRFEFIGNDSSNSHFLPPIHSHIQSN